MDFPIEGRTIVECYCARVPLLKQFKLSDDGVDEAINLAKKLATSFRDLVFPNDLFPYFHMCESDNKHKDRQRKREPKRSTNDHHPRKWERATGIQTEH